MARLEGKCAIVTGGSSGIGAATVRKFVQEGARVLVADIQEDKAQALVDEIGDAAMALAVDVCREDDVRT
jgi:NAD(P)-dependent dehydrogenase (short-subunit alcohol dehydrogenase family)